MRCLHVGPRLCFLRGIFVIFFISNDNNRQRHRYSNNGGQSQYQYTVNPVRSGLLPRVFDTETKHTTLEQSVVRISNSLLSG